MARRTRLCSLLLGLGLSAWAGEAEHQEQVFDGFLYEAADGHVWLGHPVAPLGMFGTMAFPPEYRLSPALVERFAPLVNDVGRPRGLMHWFWYNGYLARQAPLERVPTIHVRFRGRCRLVERREVSERGFGDVKPKVDVYEIEGARLLDAELLSREWLEAWRGLHEALVEIVAASLEPPSKAKRQRLAEAIEKGSQAASAMASEKVSEEAVALVRRIEPKARVVRRFQLGYPWGVRSWREQLEKYVARLRIRPTTPLPTPREPAPVLEWLAHGRPVADILADTRTSSGEDGLERSVVFLRGAKRLVYVWELDHLSPAELEEARATARERLAEKAAEAQQPKPPEPPRSQAIKELGIVGGAPSDDLMAEKLILGGIAVEELLPDGPAVGLQVGDVVLYYHRLYDLVMGGFDSRYAMRTLANRVRHGRWVGLRVLRGDRIVVILVGGGR